MFPFYYRRTSHSYPDRVSCPDSECGYLWRGRLSLSRIVSVWSKVIVCPEIFLPIPSLSSLVWCQPLLSKDHCCQDAIRMCLSCSNWYKHIRWQTCLIIKQFKIKDLFLQIFNACFINKSEFTGWPKFQDLPSIIGACSNVQILTDMLEARFITKITHFSTGILWVYQLLWLLSI